MSIELLSALALFALVSSITPGPNNLMLMASGANFGFYRTLPHMWGVGLGFTLMLIIVGLGLMQLFDVYPVSYTLLQVFSLVYLLYLAWKIANAGTIQNTDEARSKPFTFIQAALFQWVNPKAWTMALTAISLYAPDRSLLSVLIVGAIFGLINIPSVSVWVVLGKEMKRWLDQPFKLKCFNWAMAALLVLSLVPTLIS